MGTTIIERIEAVFVDTPENRGAHQPRRVAGPQHRLRNRRLRNDPPRHVRAALAALAALVPFVGATIGAIIGAFI